MRSNWIGTTILLIATAILVWLMVLAVIEMVDAGLLRAITRGY